MSKKILLGAICTVLFCGTSATVFAQDNVSGFDKVDYIGAFGPNETAAANWTSGWCNFDPQNTVY